MSKAEEYYYESDIENKTDETDDMDLWIFSKEDIITFAEDYHQSRVNAISDKTIEKQADDCTEKIGALAYLTYTSGIAWFKKQLLKK